MSRAESLHRAESLRRALVALADLLLPAPCAGCGVEGEPWCPACRRRWRRPAVLAVPGLPPVIALAPYAGTAREVVLAYKERGRRELVRPLAEHVAAALAGAGLPPAALVPAPSRPVAARARGGDHVLRLARAVVTRSRAGRTRARDGPALPRVTRALVLGRGAADSVGLDADARAENLARHLRLRPRGLPPPGAPVVLLDDVLTTGATARAATGLLAAAGYGVDAVVVLTVAGHRGGPSVVQVGAAVPHTLTGVAADTVGDTAGREAPEGSPSGRSDLHAAGTSHYRDPSHPESVNDRRRERRSPTQSREPPEACRSLPWRRDGAPSPIREVVSGDRSLWAQRRGPGSLP